MKNEFKNVIINGELGCVLLAHFNNVKDKATVLKYGENSLPFDRNENGATNNNTLYVLNSILNKILKMKQENNNVLNDTCYITIPDKLYKSIQKGTYKNWIKNGGKASSGLMYSKAEIDEWKKFSDLYSKLFLDVNFRSITYYAMSNPRYDIDNVNKHKYLIREMKKHLEEEKSKGIDDILSILN